MPKAVSRQIGEVLFIICYNSHICFRARIGSGCAGSSGNNASISTSELIFSKEGIQLESKFSGRYPKVRIWAGNIRPLFACHYRAPIACGWEESFRGIFGTKWAEMLKWSLWSSAKKRPESPGGPAMTGQDDAYLVLVPVRPQGREPGVGVWLRCSFCQT